MGQKINPTGLRIGVIKDWESRWYAKKNDFGATLVEDYEIREYLLETLAAAGVPARREYGKIWRCRNSTFEIKFTVS